MFIFTFADYTRNHKRVEAKGEKSRGKFQEGK